VQLLEAQRTLAHHFGIAIELENPLRRLRCRIQTRHAGPGRRQLVNAKPRHQHQENDDRTEAGENLRADAPILGVEQ